jgi:hypothetical protein
MVLLLGRPAIVSLYGAHCMDDLSGAIKRDIVATKPF